eukprot:CAMPEP_0197588068 /NCGR_PEP_ID=MMETSP1326-20131121/9482_1 /TAXON_ID=1155430 /ORGANISM="Genus nov. species nov., Strain RCC2288" /LENGTH=74 /DNA_ID=CAMNT_0043152861 /DNA_START=222 /DNA_END=443 /DNA_ORIENTATION=+
MVSLPPRSSAAASWTARAGCRLPPTRTAPDLPHIDWGRLQPHSGPTSGGGGGGGGNDDNDGTDGGAAAGGGGGG